VQVRLVHIEVLHAPPPSFATTEKSGIDGFAPSGFKLKDF